MKANKPKPKISLIMPAYKAEKFIKEVTLARLKELKALGLPYELIVVIDGYSKPTADALRSVKDKGLKVLHYEKNRGKGFAVKFGVLRATGDFVGFIDAGKDIKNGNIKRIIDRIRKGDVDAVIPSKWHPDSRVVYPASRKLYSRFYNLISRPLLGFKAKDTQVGAKVFTRELVDKVFPRILVKRFAFDVEVLAVAKRLGHGRFAEVAIDLEDDADSTVKLTDGLHSFWDTLAVFYRLRILRYYDKPQSLENKVIKHEIPNLKLID
ncbi:MAG: glycosyltransferase [Candidatus Dojkabacteria bacterium]